MNIISKNAQGKVLKNDVLALSQEAKKAKLNDSTVINATIGSLYNDNGEFYTFKNVDKLIKELSNEDFYSYSPSNGNKDFHDSVTHWVFGNYYNDIINKMYCESIPTPGGTGAVSNSLFNSLDLGETLLLPDIYWGPYKNMADSYGLNVVEYPFIVDNKFNIDGFISCAEKIIAKQGKLVTILNDPCNNPTGYSLSLSEFQSLIDYMNSKENVAFNVIYDIAYFDYYLLLKDEARKKFLLMTQSNDNILYNIAFSCSKTFSVYGLRLGAQIILSNNKEFVNEIYSSTCFLARTRWSNVSKAGLSMMVKLYKDSNIRNLICNEIDEAVNVVKNRALLFTKEAEECDLKIYPYTGGFFITVFANNGIELAEKLKQHKIYVLGYKKAIRIAICSIPVHEIKGLASKIKKVINDN